MNRLSDIHEASLSIENTLVMLQKPETDEKQARAALLEIYLAGYQKAKADTQSHVVAVCNLSAEAIQSSKQALQAILKLEKEVGHG